MATFRNRDLARRASKLKQRRCMDVDRRLGGLTIAKGVVGSPRALAILSEAAHSCSIRRTHHDHFRGARCPPASRRRAPTRARKVEKRHRACRDRAAVSPLPHGDLEPGIALSGRLTAVEATIVAFGVIVGRSWSTSSARGAYRVRRDRERGARSRRAAFRLRHVVVGGCFLSDLPRSSWAFHGPTRLLRSSCAVILRGRLATGRRIIGDVDRTAPAGAGERIKRIANASCRRGRR